MVALLSDPTIAMETLVLVTVVHQRSDYAPLFGILRVEV